MFFKGLTTQLLRGAEDWDLKLVNKSTVSNENHLDATILFVAEAFARICRRGSSGILIFPEPEISHFGNSTYSDVEKTRVFTVLTFWQMCC